MNLTALPNNKIEVAEPEREGRTGTLARGLAVLDVLFAASQPQGLADVAAASGLDQSTALRLLRTLEESGYVVRNNESKRFSPSPKALHPLPLLHPMEQLRRDSADVIQDLANRIGKTVVLVVFIHGERMVLDIAQTPGSLTPYYGTWLHGPLHSTGVGKALLLSHDTQSRRALLGAEPFLSETEKTMTTWQQLDADLALSARRGYVISSDEHIMGLTAVSANISGWNGTVLGCITATGHTREYAGDEFSRVGEEIVRAAGILPLQASSIGATSQFCGRY